MPKTLRATVTLFQSGGRQTPIFPREKTYRPHIVPEGSTSFLGIQVVDGPPSIGPGESARIEFECVYESLVSYDELRAGVHFDLMEARKKVGDGVIEP